MLMRPEQGVKKRRFILFFLILSTIKSFKLNFRCPYDELTYHRVVVDGNLIAVVHIPETIIYQIAGQLRTAATGVVLHPIIGGNHHILYRFPEESDW